MAAGADVFAARGFDGAGVDDIAAKAGVNKAMIYYHFKNKRGLYLEVLRDVFTALGERTAALAASDADPATKITAFLQAVDEEAGSRPYMPPLMARELAGGARHIDVDILRLMARLFGNLAAILQEGAAKGVFRPFDPALAYFSFISPVIFFRVAAPVRAAMAKHRIVPVEHLDPATFVSQLQQNALRILAVDCDGATRPGVQP